MRGEHVLDGQVEQGTQTLDDLLPRHVRAQPAGMILSPLPKFTSVSPATTVRWLSTQSTVSFGFLPGNVARLLGGEAELPHEVFGGIEQRRIDGCAEPLDQALRVALVPRRGEHDRRVAAPARPSVSLGTPSGSKRSRRSPSSIAYEETFRSHGSLDRQCGWGAVQCQRPGPSSCIASMLRTDGEGRRDHAGSVPGRVAA